MDQRHRLLELLVERSLVMGDFTLASGARSSYYVDARRTTMSAEGQALVGSVALEALRSHDLDPDWVGGLTMGADPVAYALAHRSWLDGRPVNAFSVRKQPKPHGVTRQIEGGLPESARVVVVEDTLTSGGSALRAVHAVEHHGARVLAVLALVDRESGGAEHLEAQAGVPLVRLFRASELLAHAEDPSDPPAQG